METFEGVTYQERMALAALDYLEYGFSIVPTHIGAISNGRFICTCGSSACGKSAGKHPAVPWKRYQYFRPAARQIISWAVDFPGYNIGAVHGTASGTVVLDWDGDEGWESRRQLERELGELPTTPTVITGSGGEHQLFCHPGSHIPTNKGLRPGFDVRGDGGFSVLPPSRHYLGRTYEWDVDQHVDDLPLAVLPATWIGFIAKSSSSSSSLPCDTSTEIIWTPAPDGTPLVRDGRETFMRDCVWRAFCTLERRLGRQPTPDELFRAAGDAYLPSVDLSRAGRGADELRRKCNALLARNPRHLPERRSLSKPFFTEVTVFSHIKRHREPELRYSAKGKCFRSYDPETKKCSDLPDEPMIVDLGTVRHGWELLATGKKREIALAYVNEPLPPQPSPDHQMVGAVRVVVASLGRCTIIVDSDSLADAFTALHEEYAGAAEAAEGALPIVNFINANALAFKIADWTPRNEQFLGERILPLPNR